MIPALLLRYWPHLLAVLALVAGLVWFGHTRYAAGERAGRAAVEALWEADKVDAARAVAEAAKAAAATEARQAQVAQEIQDGLQAKLDTATAGARTLSERLRNYQARRCSGPVPGTAGAASQPDPAAGEPGDSGQVAEATDAHFAACARDAARLAGWQDWWGGVSH